MRGFFRLLLIVILGVCLIHLAWQFLKLVPALLGTAALIVIVFMVIRRLVLRGRACQPAAGPILEEPGPGRRSRVNFERIDARIRNLETLLMDRINRRKA